MADPDRVGRVERGLLCSTDPMPSRFLEPGSRSGAGERWDGVVETWLGRRPMARRGGRLGSLLCLPFGRIRLSSPVIDASLGLDAWFYSQAA